jgi:hypothetical protein
MSMLETCCRLYDTGSKVSTIGTARVRVGIEFLPIIDSTLQHQEPAAVVVMARVLSIIFRL